LNKLRRSVILFIGIGFKEGNFRKILAVILKGGGLI